MSDINISFLIITTQGMCSFEFKEDIRQEIAILNVVNGRQPIVWFDDTCHRKMFRYDDSMKKSIDSFAQEFGSDTNTKPFEFRKFMKMHLAEDEPFYMFRTEGYLDSVSQIQIAHAVYQIEAIKEGKNVDEIWNNVKDDLESLLNDYEIRTLGKEDYNVGDDTDNRVCRFCGRTKADGAMFKKVSHAVSEALGNKTLTCNEECDDCNKRLASIEDNLSVAYLEIRRALCHTAGKKGVNSVAGQNFIMDAKTHQVIIHEDTHIKDLGDKIWVRLKGREVFTFQDLYKALSKIVVDLVETKEVKHFHNTIQWINGTLCANEFPPIKLMYCDTIFTQPIIELFIRKEQYDASKGPYCFANLFVCDLAFQFVVPFVDVDAGKMKTASLIMPFEKKMGATIAVYNWKSEWIDSGDTTQRTAYTEIEYDKSDLPISDCKPNVSENLHIMSPNWKHDTIEFPPFNPSIIKASKVLQCEVSDINKDVLLDEAWLRDTSNNIICNLVIDKQTNKVLVDIGIEICNTDNTEHLLNTCIIKEFSLIDLDDVLAIKEDNSIEIFRDFTSFITERSLIELDPLLGKIHPLLGAIEANTDMICRNYHYIFARW